jgi:hypothetical protein
MLLGIFVGWGVSGVRKWRWIDPNLEQRIMAFNIFTDSQGKTHTDTKTS